MNVWVVAILATCVAPGDKGDPLALVTLERLYPCRMIQNSYLDGHTIFLKKEQCLEAIGGTSKRLECVEVHEDK